MKTILILIALLLLPATAEAQWFARAKTTQGGDIVLLASKTGCNNDNWRRMYVATPTGTLLWGCWRATDLHIMAVMDAGTTYAYNYEGWTMNKPDTAPPANTGGF